VLLDPFKKREVLLQIIPLEVGDFEIQSLEWELFEVVLCKRKINLTVRKGKVDNTLRFKAIEPSGECSAQLFLKDQDIKQDSKIIFSEC
jgi:hypothetical protein